MYREFNRQSGALEILSQPDHETCGPTCLQAVYSYYGDVVDQNELISEVERVGNGGTLDVLLGLNALKRGYHATIYPYHWQILKPNEIIYANGNLSNVLKRRLASLNNQNPKLAFILNSYIEFLARGGKVCMEDLSVDLLRRQIERGAPIISGLSYTYLYDYPRGIEGDQQDDIRGYPEGHFVVISDYFKNARNFLIADPYPQPGLSLYRKINQDRLICAILLGVTTFDGSLLIIEPR